ncbi:MAG: hypothetical protein AAF490_22425 [Chloroflexota bacterium]
MRQFQLTFQRSQIRAFILIIWFSATIFLFFKYILLVDFLLPFFSLGWGILTSLLIGLPQRWGWKLLFAIPISSIIISISALVLASSYIGYRVDHTLDSLIVNAESWTIPPNIKLPIEDLNELGPHASSEYTIVGYDNFFGDNEFWVRFEDSSIIKIHLSMIDQHFWSASAYCIENCNDY